MVAPPSDADELAAQFESCKKFFEGAKRLRDPPNRTLKQRARLLSAAASLGPSGTRNTVIMAIAREPSGLVALKRLAGQWRRGRISSYTAMLFTGACMTPIDLGWRPPEPGEQPYQRRKLRPIGGPECLIKYIEGVLVQLEKPSLTKALEPHQMGCGAPDACPVVVTTVQSWLKQAQQGSQWDGVCEQEDLVAVSLDETNAYGNAFRSSCLEGVHVYAPGLAGILAAEWQTLGTPVWQRVCGEWRRSSTARGGWQGSGLMQIAYACAQERSLRSAMGSASQSLTERGITRIGILDDQYLVGSARRILDVWEDVVECLKLDGHSMAIHKTRAYAPGFDDCANDSLPPSLQQLFEVVPRSQDGLPMLGSGANGDAEVLITSTSILLRPVVERAEKAIYLTKRVDEFVASQSDPKNLHIGWLLLTKCVAPALSYDTRLVPPGFIEPVASQVHTAVEEVLAKWFVPKNDCGMAQLKLPGVFGGLGFRLSSQGLHAAGTYWAAWCSRSASACKVAAAFKADNSSMWPFMCFRS